MDWIPRVLKFGTLALLAAAVTGCIVLPCGGRHGRYAQCNDGWRAEAHEGHGAGRPAPGHDRHGR